MALIRGVPTDTARQWGSQMLALSQGLGNQRVNLESGRLNALKARRDRVLSNLQTLRQRRELKKQEEAQGDMGAGGIGGLVGMGASLVAAPFTGGASLAAMPAFASAGTGVGQLVEGDTAGGIQNLAMGAAGVSGLFIEVPNTFGPAAAGGGGFSTGRPSAGFDIPGFDI